MTDRKPGREALSGIDPRSGTFAALSAALAASEKGPHRSGPRSRSELEAHLGRAVDVIAIRCSGHASAGRVKRPRVGYAVRFDIDSGWFFGGTLSAALDIPTNAERSPWANAVRAKSYQAKQESGHEREVVTCPGCPDEFVFANGPKIAAALAWFVNHDRHTVTIRELRDRYARS